MNMTKSFYSGDYILVEKTNNKQTSKKERWSIIWATKKNGAGQGNEEEGG